MTSYHSPFTSHKPENHELREGEVEVGPASSLTKERTCASSKWSHSTTLLYFTLGILFLFLSPSCFLFCFFFFFQLKTVV